MFKPRKSRYRLHRNYKFWLHLMLACAVLSFVTGRIVLAFDGFRLVGSFIGYVASLGGGFCLLMAIIYGVRLYMYDY